MAKKKWKFTDLSDDVEIEEIKPIQNINNELNVDDLNLNKIEISNKKISQVEPNEKIIINSKPSILKGKKEIQKNVIEKEVISPIIEREKEEIKQIKTVPIIQKNINEKVKQEEYISNKYDIDIDYESDVPIKQQIQEQQKQKLHTFNETVKLEESLNRNNEKEYKFDNQKIQQFFTTKEKLDVKTNIYLKPNLVAQIQALSKQTGESRSSIINKLIEHALKEIGNK